MPAVAPKPDALALLAGRSKSLDRTRFSYKAGNQFAMDYAVADSPRVDEGRMSFILPFADGNRRDGVGDLLEVAGIRTERHQKNPVALVDHGKQVALPLGLTETRDTKEYTVFLDPVAKTAQAEVYVCQGDKGIDGVDRGRQFDHFVYCEQVFHLWAQGIIRAGSIGYQVVKAVQLQPDYDRGTPQGLHLLAVNMLECSAVILPANGDTVAKVKSMPLICGKRPSPYLIKSLEPYMPEQARTMVGFAGVKAIRNKYRRKGYDTLSWHPDDARAQADRAASKIRGLGGRIISGPRTVGRGLYLEYKLPGDPDPYKGRDMVAGIADELGAASVTSNSMHWVINPARQRQLKSLPAATKGEDPPCQAGQTEKDTGCSPKARKRPEVRTKAHGSVFPGSTNYAFQAGDRATARRHITYNAGGGKVGNFAAPGEKVEVVGLEQDGQMLRLRNASGAETTQPVALFRGSRGQRAIAGPGNCERGQTAANTGCNPAEKTFQVKDQGEPCEQGQTAANVGCVPASGNVSGSPEKVRENLEAFNGWKADFAEWADSLTPEENSAFDTWWQGTNNHKEVNGYLRSGGYSRLAKRIEPVVKNIDSALMKGSLKVDAEVYRAASAKDLPQLDPKQGDALVGVEFTDLGYVATSADKDYVQKFAMAYLKKPFTIIIKLKTGQKGAYLDARKDMKEREFLLPRNQTFKVVSVDKKSKRLIVEIPNSGGV